ncbi:MAG: ABC transporter permease [Agarilytica sp.]
MRLPDYWKFSLPVFLRHPTRTLLLTLAIAIGVSSVILLTSLAEGARNFIEKEFSSLGSDLLIILPGKKETQGGAPPIYGATPRDLTLDDTKAIEHINTIERIAPIIAGTALISYRNRSREAITIGSTPHIFPIRNLNVNSGVQLPTSSFNIHSPVIVIGAKLKRELFGSANAIGEWLRLGSYRFRVIGVLAERGESLGLDFRDMAIIPVHSAEMVFDSPALFRVLVQLRHTDSEQYTQQRIRTIIAARHEGEDDISFISQDAMLSSFNSILNVVTGVVGSVAGISLIVAGILIMNVTYISISQRRKEIGLLKALGADASQIKYIFVGEALLLTLAGAIGGLIIALSLIQAVHWFWPSFPIKASSWALFAALFTAFFMSFVFSWFPAKHAAKLDPILALRGIR